MFSKIFGFKGVFNRVEYLVWGVIVPLVLFAIMAIFPPIGLLALYFMIVSAIKRARETGTNTILIFFLWLILLPLTVAYLLIAPAKGQPLGLGKILAILLIAILFSAFVGGILSTVIKPIKQKAMEAQHKNTVTNPITNSYKKENEK